MRRIVRGKYQVVHKFFHPHPSAILFHPTLVTIIALNTGELYCPFRASQPLQQYRGCVDVIQLYYEQEQTE